MSYRSHLIISLLVASVIGMCDESSVFAQNYPNKIIRIIVPNTPGSTQDILPRIMTAEMSSALGQTIIVENKPGADSRIGYEYVAKEVPADGYTIASVNVTGLASLPFTTKDLRFDPLKDLPPIVGLAESRFALVSSINEPWKTFDELVAYAKANPGKLNYGASVPIVQLPMEELIRNLGLNIVHVPYPASALFVQALVGGEVQMGIVPEGYSTSLRDKLRTLALTGPRRREPFMDVPTFAELGFPQIPGTSFSLNVRAGTPKAVIDKLYAAASKALQNPAVKAQFEKAQLEIVNESPEHAANSLSAQGRFFAEITKKVDYQKN